MDKYRKVRRVLRKTAQGAYERLAARLHPRAFQTVMGVDGQLVNRYYGPGLAIEALKKAKENV